MKKKILSATFAVAIMAVAGYNVYMNQAKVNMSELALANVEALANFTEFYWGYKSVPTTCPQPFDYKKSVACLKNEGNEPDCVGSSCF